MQMGALLTGVEKMSTLISRCQIYETLYTERGQFDGEEWKQAVMNLTSALVALYANMLGFLGSAIRMYDQGAFFRTLCAMLNPDEVIGFLSKCQTLETNVAIEVDNCDRIHSRLVQASSAEHIQRLKQILGDLETPILRINSGIAALCQKTDSSEHREILRWILGIRYEENHFFARQGRTNGTGEWVLRHERYHGWRTSSASAMLWLHGDREYCYVLVLRERF